MKKIPLRTCLVTREKCEKHELLRVVRTPEKEIVFDKTGKANGKGAYLKKDRDVILKAQKTKVLNRVFEMEVPDDIYTELLGEVNE
ncbi:MAG: YlxR family protein [Bacilli bacterium]|nr:YlxR family protein [Bacilli bacterium]